MAIDEKQFAGRGIDPATGEPHAIGHQPEDAEWEPGVYQWECGDWVLGGAGGILNLPLRQLANRTAYLKGIFGLLAAFAKDVQDKIPPTLPIRSAPMEAIALPMGMGAESPGAASAWIRTDAGTAKGVQAEYLLEGGGKISAMGTVSEGGEAQHVGGPKAGTAGSGAAYILFDGAAESGDLHPAYLLEDGSEIRDARATIAGDGAVFYAGGPTAGIDWGRIIDGGIQPSGDIITNEDIDSLFN